jgi:hypothetical protein
MFDWQQLADPFDFGFIVNASSGIVWNCFVKTID